MPRTYEKAWSDLLRRRVIGFVAPFAGFIAVASLFGPVAGFVSAVAAMLVCNAWASRFRCPRCEGTYRPWWMRDGLDSRCNECGLEDDELPDFCATCDGLLEAYALDSPEGVAELAASVLPLVERGRLEQTAGTPELPEVAHGRSRGAVDLRLRCAACHFEYRLQADAAGRGRWRLQAR
ncbi:MAG: hypothetical protein U0229_02995 [Anaeromyxobacter sp.]